MSEDVSAANDSSGLLEFLPGPFLYRADVLERLDDADPSGSCEKSGKLLFNCLIQARATEADREAPKGTLANAFNLRVAKTIRETIQLDLLELSRSNEDGERTALDIGFLTHPASRIELVGVVNRIDRQFINDKASGSEDHERCGEISVIYRFSYSLRGEGVESRLPVTMNVVFPAVPVRTPDGASNCREVADLWVRELSRSADRPPEQIISDLIDAKTGIISILDGRDIDRIELNMQAYRIKSGNDRTDFGSTAEYVIRVFRWSKEQKRFIVSYLTNQIDRAKILGKTEGSNDSCKDTTESKPEVYRERFKKYLTNPKTMADIDNGTLNIPRIYLACRALTASPGGLHRSKNQPFWKAPSSRDQIISDDEIRAALRKMAGSKRQFSFMKSPDDVRTRLNELTCSGCHQTRAIAGFHFPGADRKKTPSSNAVFLPGSPHFYGDQPRRLRILRRVAHGEKLSRYDLASSYASRPLAMFKPELYDSTELIGGWGGVCLFPNSSAPSQRQWTCKPGLKCEQLFVSSNAPNVGTCVPNGNPQIGDAVQVGTVTTTRYGIDRYMRKTPTPEQPPLWTDLRYRKTLIPDGYPPKAAAPEGNSYFASHQEYYEGDSSGLAPPPAFFVNRRNAKTGGFPAGMLRLSECIGLPQEATCGLLASDGFGDCLTDVRENGKKLSECFVERTSYAGVRACDAARPCRDDYICLRPLGYTAATGHDAYLDRRIAVSDHYKCDFGRQGSDRNACDFGQQEPDRAWLNRNGGRGDQRGMCIPPYFVFQFRSDGHPSPMARD